jgi:mono/diheme cytochrome c family protein
MQCSACHGQNGAGDTSIGKSLKAADLRSAEVQKQSDAQLAQVISDGRKNMPSFSDSLTQDQIRSLVATKCGAARLNLSVLIQ